MRILSRRVVNDDRMGPGGLEQSTVPGIPFDTPGHIGGFDRLACGALYDAAIAQLLRQDALLGADEQACGALRDAAVSRSFLAACLALPLAESEDRLQQQ
jgi:hypothetical protein